MYCFVCSNGGFLSYVLDWINSNQTCNRNMKWYFIANSLERSLDTPLHESLLTAKLVYPRIREAPPELTRKHHSRIFRHCSSKAWATTVWTAIVICQTARKCTMSLHFPAFHSCLYPRCTMELEVLAMDVQWLPQPCWWRDPEQRATM